MNLVKYKLLLLGVSMALLTLYAPLAHTAAFVSTGATDNWDDAAAWTAGSGFPQAGDSVTITNNRFLNNTNQEFGTSAQESIWAAAGSNTHFRMQDDSITHSGNSIFRMAASGVAFGGLSNPKGWTFINKAGSTFSHDTAGDFSITCGLNLSDQGGFINEGTFRFTTGGGRLQLARSAWFKNIGTLVNHSGATITINNSAAESATFSNGAAAVFASIGDGSIIQYSADKLYVAGTFRALTNAEIRLDPSQTGGAVLACDPSTIFHGDVASTGVVHITGDWGIDLVGVATGNVVIAQQALFTLPTSVPNLSINMDASGASGGTGANPTPGTIVLRGTIGVGTNTITLNTPASMGDGTLNINSAVTPKNGTFVNATGNTFTHSSASTFNIVCQTGGQGVKFRNDGTYVFTVDEGDLDISSGAGNQFINSASGVVRCNVGTGNTARITGGAGAPFDNQGRVEALSGEMDIQAAVSVVQFDNGALTGGTWEITDELDMNPAAAGIHTISGSAVVRLRGSSASFNELMGNLLTNAGTFGTHSGHVYNAGADFVTPGVLEFGLRDADASQTAVFSGVSNITAAILTGGKVDVVDLGLTEANTFTLLSFVSSIGALAIGNVPDNDFVYQLIQNTNNVQIKVTPPPEGTIFVFQ